MFLIIGFMEPKEWNNYRKNKLLVGYIVPTSKELIKTTFMISTTKHMKITKDKFVPAERNLTR
jgi:hypothetical protein